MLTHLDEVFQTPSQPGQEEAFDPTDIEAIAQHERDRLAALRAEKQQREDESTQETVQTAEPQEAEHREAQEHVSVSISETGAVKLAVMAAQAVEQGHTPEGKDSQGMEQLLQFTGAYILDK